MGTSSAIVEELEQYASLLFDWSEGLGEWERRLSNSASRPAFAASSAVRCFRLTVVSQRDRVLERAGGFRRADASLDLVTLNRRVHRALRDSAAREHGDRAKLQSGLAAKNDRVYLRGDTRNDGQLVEVLGDLVYAEHIVILVPGMTNELANFETQIRPRAVSLLGELKRQAPTTKVAVVAWLGYDSPDLSFTGLLQARQSGRAKVGAESLARDLATIRALNSSAHLTVIGHSYGTVVLGQAMMRGLDRRGVTDVIVVGSPGMDANNRRDLGSPEISLWASKGTVSTRFPLPMPLPFPFPGVRKLTLDPISFAPAHGEDPSAKGFGAKRFSSEGAKTHGAYFDPGSAAMKNMVKIALGHGETVTK